MFRRVLLLLIVLLICLDPTASQEKPPAPQQQPVAIANPADVASPEAIIAALYDVISGPTSQPRNWERFRSLFAPGARLVDRKSVV